MEAELYHNIVWKKFRKYFPKKTEQEINDYFHIKEKEKIFCKYCGEELKVNTPYPYYNAPSIDHKIPTSREGKNEFNNIAICCHECNIVKGTMLAETYEKMLELISISPEWQDRIMHELFLGRQANKLERVKRTKIPKRKLHDFV